VQTRVTLQLSLVNGNALLISLDVSSLPAVIQFEASEKIEKSVSLFSM